MIKLFDPDDDDARKAIEEFCFTHPLTFSFKNSADPYKSHIGNPLYEMVSILEMARPFVCRGSFVASFKERFQFYADKEDATKDWNVLCHIQWERLLTEGVFALGEPELTAIVDDYSYITSTNLELDTKEDFFYSTDELKKQLLGLIHAHQDNSNFPYPSDINHQRLKIPRCLYDALLCIYRDKLNPINPAPSSEYMYW